MTGLYCKIENDISDHCSTICKFNKSEVKNTIKFVTYRDFNNFDENFFFQNFHLID